MRSSVREAFAAGGGAAVSPPPPPALLLYAKGSPEAIRALVDPASVPADFDAVLGGFTREGLRVLALAVGPALLWTAALLIGLAAGIIMVLFFSIWGLAFGPRQLGRIQGAAQLLTVLASAIGPLIFAHVHASWGSFTPALAVLAVGVALAGVVAWCTRLPRAAGTTLNATA